VQRVLAAEIILAAGLWVSSMAPASAGLIKCKNAVPETQVDGTILKPMALLPTEVERKDLQCWAIQIIVT
jgi:hypothetical protein